MKKTRKTSTTFVEDRWQRDREVAYGEPCKHVHEQRTVVLTADLTLEYDPDLFFQAYAECLFRERQGHKDKRIDMRSAKRILALANFQASWESMTREEGEWKIVSVHDTIELSEQARIRSGLSREEASFIRQLGSSTSLSTGRLVQKTWTSS
jgi:hypothetical protein